MTQRNVDDAVDLVRSQPCSFSPTSSCRDNLKKNSGATTPGFSGPLPSPPSCFESTSVRWSVFGSPPLCDARSVFGSPPLRSFHHCPVPAFPLTHSPEGGSQWCRITRGVPTPRLLGVAKRWCCFGSHTLPSRTVALLTQSYPAELGGNSRTTWGLDFHYELLGGRSPRW